MTRLQTLQQSRCSFIMSLFQFQLPTIINVQKKLAVSKTRGKKKKLLYLNLHGLKYTSKNIFVVKI